MLLGSRIATPLCFGVAVLDSQDFRLMLFSVGLGFVVLWWFENWIVDASKNTKLFVLFFAFINFNRLHFGGVVLIVL